jgi:hypothetical protein
MSGYDERDISSVKAGTQIVGYATDDPAYKDYSNFLSLADELAIEHMEYVRDFDNDGCVLEGTIETNQQLIIKLYYKHA